MCASHRRDAEERLQGSLYLPANYQKGKQYPLVVYIYERQMQSHFTYGRPTANGFSRQAYTSSGYAVLMPNITGRLKRFSRPVGDVARPWPARPANTQG